MFSDQEKNKKRADPHHIKLYKSTKCWKDFRYEIDSFPVKKGAPNTEAWASRKEWNFQYKNCQISQPWVWLKTQEVTTPDLTSFRPSNFGRPLLMTSSTLPVGRNHSLGWEASESLPCPWPPTSTQAQLPSVAAPLLTRRHVCWAPVNPLGPLLLLPLVEGHFPSRLTLL